MHNQPSMFVGVAVALNVGPLLSHLYGWMVLPFLPWTEWETMGNIGRPP